jgi:hypothetical protein
VKAEQLRDDLLDGFAEMLRGVEDRIVARVLAELRNGQPKPKAALNPKRRALVAALVAQMDRNLEFDVDTVFEAAAVDEPLSAALTKCGATTHEKLGALLRSLKHYDLEGVRLTRVGRKWELST